MKLLQILCVLGLSSFTFAEQQLSICGSTCGTGGDDPSGSDLLIRCGVCDEADPQVCRVGADTLTCNSGGSCTSGCYHDTNPFAGTQTVQCC